MSDTTLLKGNLFPGPQVENATNDSNFEYSNELKQRMNDSNASLAHSPERMSEFPMQRPFAIAF